MTLTLLLTAFLAASANATFTPVENWRSAAIAGDSQALARLYDRSASGRVVNGKAPTQSDDEIAFWGSLKASGITSLDPKILEISRTGDKASVVMRVLAVRAGEHVVASVTQLWAHEPEGWRIVATKRSEFVRDAVRILPQPAKPNVDLYADPGEGPAELAAAEKQAAKEKKRVIVVFGGNWCYDCHVLDTTFHSPEFAPLVNANYVVVHINIGDEGKDNHELAARLGVVLDKGVPSLGVLEPDGTVVYAQKNGEFESTVKIGPADVRAFLEKWKPRRSG